MNNAEVSQLRIVKAPAKINLFLRVVGRREDGYHDLQTVFQLLDWCDEIRIEVSADGRIERGADIPQIPTSSDLTLRAAQLLREYYPGKQGATITSYKSVPIGSGLGGGSSSAAAVLVALNDLWQLGLDVGKLAEIGVQIGADVPVFIHGKNAWAEGRGEKLSQISLPEQLYVVIYPGIETSTRQVFESLDPNSFKATVSIDEFIGGEVGNDLQPMATNLNPKIQQALDWLADRGATPRMTGSGSSVFAPLVDHAEGQAYLRNLPRNWVGRVCVGLGSKQ